MYAFDKNSHFSIILGKKNGNCNRQKKKEEKAAKHKMKKRIQSAKRDFIILSFRIHINIEVSRIFPYRMENTLAFY